MQGKATIRCQWLFPITYKKEEGLQTISGPNGYNRFPPCINFMNLIANETKKIAQAVEREMKMTKYKAINESDNNLNIAQSRPMKRWIYMEGKQ
jgi:hypothetical protein